MKIQKNIIMILVLIVLLPSVSAVETHYFKALDLFALFVENIFGNILISIFGLALIFFVIGAISRMSQLSMFFLIGSFLAIMFMGYFGALAAVPIFIFVFWYFIRGLINFVNSIRA